MTITMKREEVGYVHSFAHTPNFMVFFQFPLTWGILQIPIRNGIGVSILGSGHSYPAGHSDGLVAFSPTQNVPASH